MGRAARELRQEGEQQRQQRIQHQPQIGAQEGNWAVIKVTIDARVPYIQDVQTSQGVQLVWRLLDLDILYSGFEDEVFYNLSNKFDVVRAKV
jgi:hypothetical protein